ncbi:FMN-binding protein [bacterium]|nr:FMN-binding protein [bacterium]
MKQILFLFTALLLAKISFAETVYLAPADALKLAFPNASFIIEKKTLTPEQKNTLEKQVGKITKDTFNFNVAKVSGSTVGYALIDNEIGKTEPITFMTALNADGSVKSIEILVYRESYGSQVSGKGFLNQFNGKTTANPLKLGGDINNVTGATFSSKGITKGVKRALALWRVLYGQ